MGGWWGAGGGLVGGWWGAVGHLTITSHWLHTSFHLGPLAGSRTSTPGHSGHPLTPREFSPWAQVGWEQEEQEEPELIPGNGGVL